MTIEQGTRAAVAVLAGAVLFGGAAMPAGAADFYAGKSIDFVIGGNPGGGYDTYARTIARHLSAHIPGQPSIIAKNMPGAGSTKAAVYMFRVAPKDGTVIAAVYPGAVMGPLLDDRMKSKFKPTDFAYIGSAASGTRVCATFQTSKIKTFQDAQQNRTVLGASAAGGSTRDYPLLLNTLTGTKFDIVSGYKGTVDILLAMERGEVDGLCGYDWSSLTSQRSDWLRDGKMHVLVQMALDPHPQLTKLGVPQVWQFLKNDDDRRLMELVLGQQVFGRPYIAPPGTPADRVAILRTAFDQTMTDPAFLKEADKSRIVITPTSGEKVQELVAKLYATPERIVERAKDAMMPSRAGSKKNK